MAPSPPPPRWWAERWHRAMRARLTAGLAPRWQRFVAEQVAAGRYAGPAQVIERGLHALERREKALWLVREAVATGLAEAEGAQFASDIEIDVAADTSASKAAYRLTPSAREFLGKAAEKAQKDAGDGYAESLVSLLLDRMAFLAARPAAGTRRPDLGPEIACFPDHGHTIYYREAVLGIEVIALLPSLADHPLHDID
ncbi:MAG: type II toxin-antitoxin system ParD family antitoxin [Pseudomonadota bacterium]